MTGKRVPELTDSHAVSEAIALSVVVSAHNSSATLGEVLAALRRSALERHFYEIIVVDDASTDGSVALAARYADTVVKLRGRRAGPAYARNRGVEQARGEIIAFVDDDVIVRPDTLSRMLEMLLQRPEIAAVSASRDEHSGAPNFASRYWNALHRFGEQRYRDQCAQFAAGCGAVRRKAFLAAGMYDEWRFGSACMENLELGERLLRAERGVLFSSELKVTHLRKWDIREIGRQVWRRGGILTRSLGYLRMSAAAPGDVVFTLSRALIPALALISTLMLAAALMPAPHLLAKGAVALLVLFLTDIPVHRFYARAEGVGFALMAMPLHLVAQAVAAVALCCGWILRDVFGDVSPDATTQAYAEVGLEIWPPIPRKL